MKYMYYDSCLIANSPYLPDILRMCPCFIGLGTSKPITTYSSICPLFTSEGAALPLGGVGSLTSGGGGGGG